MESVKNSIRNALERGDPLDKTHREKVYRQVFSAFERSLAEKQDLSSAEKADRRSRLLQVISQIEKEFVPAGPPATVAASIPRRRQPASEAQAPTAPSPAAPTVTAHDRLNPAAPTVQTGTERPQRSEPALDAPAPAAPQTAGMRGLAADDRLAPEERAAVAPRSRRQKKHASRDERPRRPFAKLFVTTTILAMLGIGAWWVMDTGLLKSAAERDGSVPNPPRGTEEESYDPGSGSEARAPIGGSPDDRTWITIFSPDDPTTVAAPAGAQAQIADSGEGQLMRLSSGQTDTAVIFDVGQGILEQLAGKTAIFNVTAAAGEGEETQLSLSCNFGNLGDCGRIRYVVGPQQNDHLFERTFPDVDPESGGTIAIVPDVEGQGRELGIYSIKVTVYDAE
ncbi:hypothetical protein [Nitratireductor basaltis]|uniref:Uncharacterized protein n=1 Tax=Nitratireductor basaltis TaxID=472175 RepID=A0A084UE39_9HYPH|nr:hypothetical protein [Nitratireductor basaltis]KFB11225.1 hypothetical protein EL18_02271 [Nitratireductor basaltis]